MCAMHIEHLERIKHLAPFFRKINVNLCEQPSVTPPKACIQQNVTARFIAQFVNATLNNSAFI